MYATTHLTKKQIEIKELAEARFFKFVRLVAPHLNLGHVHEDVCNWIQMNTESGVLRQLVLLPRGHLKSTLIALYVAWRIVKRPWITILYASASGDLAEKQLDAITQILTGPDVSFYWRGLIHAKISDREKWRTKAIQVDHHERKARAIRDDTIRAMSVGSTITGDHYDLSILDDIIAPNSDADPWSVSGREMADRWYAQLASVMNPGSELIAVGTRYHKKDLYSKMQESERTVYDESGNVIEKIKLFACLIKVTEINGQFLWPRKQALNGEWYGFNDQILDEIRETYRKSGQMEQFYAQYYQNPSDEENPKIKTSFLYYDKEQLIWANGGWNVKRDTWLDRLNVFAAMDLAFTTRPDSDYTAIIVEGCDPNNYRYVLDIDRFRTRDPYEMMEHLFVLSARWNFIKVRIETTAGQVMFIPILQKAMIEKNQRFIVEEYKPQIKKEERIMATLSPLYQLQQVYHFRGGACEELEKQLIQQKPEHDDVADVHAAVQEIMFVPSSNYRKKEPKIIYNSRFGGIQEVKYA